MGCRRSRSFCITLLSAFVFVFVFITVDTSATEVIRINQLGYLPQSKKVAVFLSDEQLDVNTFAVYAVNASQLVLEGKTKATDATNWGMKTALRLDFSNIETPGEYFIQVGETRSPNIRIAANAYEGTADFILNYLRQQRCGYNPFLKDSCHTHDGVIVDHPTRTGQPVDVTGGWHDASDYLQYSTTSVNTVFQMMFAYQRNPEIYGDEYDANGEMGSNGIPDILDEIKWGLQWMLKMNPAPDEMYNQIADDRDHAGFRLPTEDKVDYGLGKYRPVYFVTGKPQGLAEFKNQSTGVSSIAGKFASGFALAARLFAESDPAFAGQLKNKALDAWHFALSDTGFCQTACNVSPYFYEERNYADDLELAAAQLYELTNDRKFLKEAVLWGEKEPVSPWIRDDGARHYESYPFVNLGHYYLADNQKMEFAADYKKGLELLYQRGKADPFFNGLPFIWCSNNLLAGAITQASLYHQQTGDTTFCEMEAALRDWLFGCNPWGTAMICGLPGVDDSPMRPHSSYTVLLGETTYGGLVDGPVSSSIYSSLIGIDLKEADEYAAFNNGKAVYHDDIGDYSTNEPTMDGTASLSYYLSSLEAEGRKQAKHYVTDEQGAIIRINPHEKNIFLAFTADSFFEGGDHILKVLGNHQIKASFFFTGNFLTNPKYKNITQDIVSQGHYAGIHSDGHLLYVPWEKRDSTLIAKNDFKEDVKNNLAKLEKFGVDRRKATFFMPPYEWYNRAIVNWSSEMGLNLICFTPGTGTNADYTTPEMANYRSSDELMEHLLKFEKNKGLNGAILLIHPGTAPERKDKFYLRLEAIIDYFSNLGYTFKALPH